MSAACQPGARPAGRAVIVGLLGAESTGKTWLAGALCDKARALGVDAVVVPEYLREFCERSGRTPAAHEQRSVMETQTQRIVQAACAASLVLADTTALMTAAYSRLLFDDDRLESLALSDHAVCDFTLLLRPDIPWQADGPVRDGPHSRQPVHAWLQATLSRAGVPHAEVQGTGSGRVAGAWAALASRRLVPSDPAAAGARA